MCRFPHQALSPSPNHTVASGAILLKVSELVLASFLPTRGQTYTHATYPPHTPNKLTDLNKKGSPQSETAECKAHIAARGARQLAPPCQLACLVKLASTHMHNVWPIYIVKLTSAPNPSPDSHLLSFRPQPLLNSSLSCRSWMRRLTWPQEQAACEAFTKKDIQKDQSA